MARSLPLVLVPMLVMACSTDSLYSDRDLPGYTGAEVETPERPDAETFGYFVSESGTLAGEMPTAGSFDTEAETWLVAANGYLDFQLDVYTESGWAMIGGSMMLDEPLAAGQELPLDEFTIGCSGLYPGDYSFDGPADDGTIVIGETAQGDLMATVSMDFGTIGWTTAEVPLTPGQ